MTLARKPAGNGSTAADFRGTLARLGLAQYEAARRMKAMGDPRPLASVIRNVSEWCRLDRAAELPWPAVMVMRMLEARAQEPRDAP